MAVNRYETTNVYIWAFGVWEPAITYLLQDVLTDQEVFVDIGSHIGYFSVIAEAEGARAIAVEPSPMHINKIKNNLDLNRLTTPVIGVAISEKKGRAQFFSGQEQNSGKGSLLESWTRHDGSFEVPTDTIDVVSQYFEDIGTIKSDVEGFERVVLEQIAARLDKMPRLSTIIFEMHPSEVAECRGVIERLARHGFRLYGVENEYSVRFYRKKRFTVSPVSVGAEGRRVFTDFVLTKKDLRAAYP